MVFNKHLINLRKIVHGNLETNVSMKNHTSFRIGGNASVILYPSELTDLLESINYLTKHKIKYYVFGLGTNLLVTDSNLDYVLIKLGRNFNHISVMEDKIIAYSGASVNSICMLAYNNALSGMEGLFGIPGTIGGAVLMNAGAFNYCTADVVTTVVALVDGKLKVFDNIKFDYRYSMFQDIDNCVILQVELKLNFADKAQIKEKMDSVMEQRKQTQPLDKPSAGSVFKRCEGVVVSKKIDELGLKGLTVGGAMVSEKHAGFIVNNRNASCKDVKQLINIIKQKFEQQCNVKLTDEIKYLGE